MTGKASCISIRWLSVVLFHVFAVLSVFGTVGETETADGLSIYEQAGIDGYETGSQFGAHTGTAGDVDGDGYADLLVGAHLATVTNREHTGTVILPGAGCVYLYLGRAGGISSRPAWSACGTETNEYFGFSVAAAGDLNADGYADVAIGAYGYGEAGLGKSEDRGRVYVYYGGSNGLPASPGLTLTGAQANERLGRSVAGAGDVNGDGFSDLIVGAPFYGAGDEGRASVYLGGVGGLGSTPAWTVYGTETNEHVGLAVDTAGDVDGNLCADVIVGAPGHLAGRGAARIYAGSAGGPGATPVWTAVGPTACGFAESLGAAGDSDGDGYADVIVGASFGGPAGHGAAYVYRGGSGGPSTNAAQQFLGGAEDAWFGQAVRGIGDVNGDGFGDVVVGSHRAGSSPSMLPGRVYVYTGSAAGLQLEWSREGTQDGEGFGFGAAPAGDLNGDGYSDLVVGSPYYRGTGRVTLFVGAGDRLATAAGWARIGPFKYFGNSVAAAGDVDGDGYGDVVVGAPTGTRGESMEGLALLYRGSATGLQASASWTGEINQVDAGFGWSVAGAGDVDGDGYADVIVGVPDYDQGGADKGAACLYRGAASGLSASPAWVRYGSATSAVFGTSVAGAGDVNGDGYADAIVGEPGWFSTGLRGRAHLFLGSPTGVLGSAAWSGQGEQAGDRYGAKVASAGDVNGDGFADVLVGAPTYAHEGTLNGKVYLYAGSPTGLSAVALWDSIGPTLYPTPEFGCAVAGAGDVNGDGYGDIAIGARFANAGRGRAYVYFGGSSGPAAIPDWFFEGGQSNGYAGASVGSAGDVDGDGFADVMVGAPGYAEGATSGKGAAWVFLGSATGVTANTWFKFGPSAGAGYGTAVASAGDVNGDGLSEALIGAPTYNPPSSDGYAELYYGGGGPGIGPRARQMTSGHLDVAHEGIPDAADGFVLATLQKTTPLGPGYTRMHWQTAAPLEGFGGPRGTEGFSPSFTAARASSTERHDTVSGVPVAGPCVWRVRIVYPPGNTFGLAHSRWILFPRLGGREPYLKIGGAELLFTQVARLAPQTTRLSWTTLPGATYQLQRSNSVWPPAWSDIGPTAFAPGVALQRDVADPAAPSVYRVNLIDTGR